MAHGAWGGVSSSSSKSKGGSWGGVSLSAAKKSKERGGIVGFFEHLGEDVRDAAVGLPMGVAMLATHPVRTAKQSAAASWQTWSPLVHGDFGKFGHEFVQHPLAPILDIAAVASLGLGTAARIGETGALGSRVARLATRDELKIAGPTADAPSMTRALSRRRGARFRQNITAELRGRSHPIYSNESLYKKLSQKEATRQQFALNARMNQLGKAYKDISDPAKQRQVFEHMYWQVRKGPARALATKNLVNGKAPAGWRFVEENTDNSMFDHVAHKTARGEGDFIKELHSVDQRFTTSSFEQAAKQKGGKEVLIVPERAVRAYGAEAGRSASFIRKAYDYPTRAWRAAVLNLRPAYVVNNAVGNTFMFMMNHGDMTGARAWVDSIKQVKGAKALERLDVGGKNPRWMETHFGDEVANTFSGEAQRGFEGPGALRKLGRGVMPVNMKLERMFRRALINSEMRRLPEVKSLMDKGVSFDAAASKVLNRHPSVRAKVLDHAHNTLGDYVALSKVDRQVRDLIPFWAWDKTIARHTGKLVDEQPVKAAAGAAIGQQGTAATQDALGEIPGFLKGAVPLPFSFGPMEAGRKSIATTQGTNPYSTIPDLLGTIQSLAGGGDRPASEAVGALIGPIPTIAIEGFTGARSSGAPIPDTGLGPFGNAARDTIVNLPPAQLLAAATGHLPPSTTIDKRTGERRQKLYQKDWQSVVSSWLGTPTRKLSPEAALSMARKEEERRHIVGEGAR